MRHGITNEPRTAPVEDALGSPRPNERLDYIDALRGVAIAGVVLIHCGQIIDGLPRWLRSLTDYAGSGVQLFFLLSALTLASVYSNRRIRFGDFLCRRFFRIAPMFYLGIGFYLWFYGTGARFFAPLGVHVRQVLLTVSFLHGWLPDSFNAIVPGGWSIGDEAMFYLLFPLLFRSLNSPIRAIGTFVAAAIFTRAVIVLAGWTLGRDDLMIVFAHFSFPAQLVAFVGGFVVFQVGRVIPPSLPHQTFGATLLLALAAAALLAAGSSQSVLLRHNVVADALFIVFVLMTRLSECPLIVNALLIGLGRLSYSIYLVHFAVVDIARVYGLSLLKSIAPSLQLAMVFPLSLSAAAVISIVTYRIVEQPAIAFGRALIARNSYRQRAMKESAA